MQNIRQSKEYASFMEKLGWKIERMYNVSAFAKASADKQFTIYNYIYIRQFPIIGSLIKILRPQVIPNNKDLAQLKKYRPFKIQIEPGIRNVSKSVTPVTEKYKKLGFKPSNDPLIPSKTILIDLRPTEEKIFSTFSEEKRRAVRRAIKNKIVVSKSDNIEDFIKLKNQQLWPFGFLLTGEINKLWEVFESFNKAILLVAYLSTEKIHEPVGGVFLLFYQKTVYYWLASATREGKRLFAPSLLVWEAIKLGKKLGYETFDFEGIEDERFPKTKSWRGFSKFKKGFGGREIIYSQPVQKLFLPIL